MLIIPAIDLKDGQCVRLEQGEMEKTTVFSQSPEKMAAHWESCGAKRLHLVDLNGAFKGSPQNKKAVEAILKNLNIPIQLGGGIRDLKTIESLLNSGVSWVILGTVAITNPALVKEAARIFPNRVMVGLDAKDGKIATDGWAKVSQFDALEVAKSFEDVGVSTIIYTDIARDGMLTGINVEATLHLAENLTIPVIASGGLAGLADIQKLQQTGAISGVIAGRAIYNGDLDFKKALRLLEQ